MMAETIFLNRAICCIRFPRLPGKAAGGASNIITVAWAGTICSSPALYCPSPVPAERYSHAQFWQNRKKFVVVNLVTGSGAYAMNYCGVKEIRAQINIKRWSQHRRPLKNCNERSTCREIKEEESVVWLSLKYLFTCDESKWKSWELIIYLMC